MLNQNISKLILSFTLFFGTMQNAYCVVGIATGGLGWILGGVGGLAFSALTASMPKSRADNSLAAPFCIAGITLLESSQNHSFKKLSKADGDFWKLSQLQRDNWNNDLESLNTLNELEITHPPQLKQILMKLLNQGDIHHSTYVLLTQ